MTKAPLSEEVKICPILSLGPLMSNNASPGSKNPILCWREKCGFWNVIAVATPDGPPRMMGSCGVAQLPNLVASVSQAIINATTEPEPEP